MIARGIVLGVRAATLEVRLPGATVGAGIAVTHAGGRLTGEIRAIDRDRATVAVYGPAEGVARGACVTSDRSSRRMALGTCALGRALDACGNPLDGGPPPRGRRVALDAAPLSPADREPVERPFWTGVRVIDGLLTFGGGARIGIFGPPGAGKSTLLETIVRGCDADAVVVGLAGERGREARAWIGGRDRRTTVICATGDRPAAERVRCAWTSFAHARALRDRGLNVLLVLDSLARVAAALRELAVAAGESSGRGGYPPSVFADLARLVEHGGAGRSGSITLIATVLSDGDDRDPVSEAARSLLDGHLQLSPSLAQAGRFPAVDVLASTSRTMSSVAGPEHLRAAETVRRALAVLDRIDDARTLGIRPSEPDAVCVLEAEPRLERFLRQGKQTSPPEQTLTMLTELADTLDGSHGYF